MRTISKILPITAICAAFLFPSCEVEKEWNISQAKQLRLAADINEIQTKAAASGFCNGDSFGVYVVNYTDASTPGSLSSEGNQADNIRYTYDASSNVWNPEKEVYYKDAETKVDIYGYYPFDNNVDDVHSYSFQIAENQNVSSLSGEDGYEASDFLWGKNSGVVPTDNIVTILFKHRMSSISISLIKGDGWESESEWESATKDVLVCNTVRTASVNLATGIVSSSGEVPQTQLVPKKLDGDSWRAIIVPQEVAAGKEVVTVTVNGLSSSYIRTDSYQYYQGKMNVLTLEVSKKNQSGIGLEVVSESISPWENVDSEKTAKEYLVINCPEAGKLEEVLAAGGYDLSSITSLKLTGEINSLDFYLMNTKMDNLEALNLEDVRIGEYKKEYEDYDVPMANEADCFPRYAFQNKETLVSVILPKKLKEIGSWAFSRTSLSGPLSIPDGVVVIGGEAFSNIQTLNAGVSFPSSLRKIEGGVFNNTSLRGQIQLPSCLRYIGEMSFYNSSISGNLSLPDSLEYLGYSAFGSCSGLTGSLAIPDKIKEIPSGCFHNCSFDGELILNDNIESIGTGALSYCGFTGPLVLPESLKKISEEGLRFNHFSSLVIKSTNLSIGSNAFNCSIYGGILELPEGIISIGRGAFGCNQIESLYLPSSLESIGAEAFTCCYNLSEIICESNIPPQLGEGAFQDVPKDNFTVVVPASSVSDYQSAEGWNEFKRIEANRNFSISRRLYRTLNVASEKSFTLRAEAGVSWSVQSKPDWVSVEPSSGTGKTELTVSVEELAAGNESRTGEIVYALDGEDYTVSTTVEQYDYAYADGGVIVSQTHSKGSGIDIVFIGDGYDAKDIADGKYLDNINEAIGYLFSIEPYKSYKEYFDISIVLANSEDSGIQYSNIIRNTKFGTTYTQKYGLKADENICDEYASKAVESLGKEILIVLICNTDQFTGKSYLYPDKRSISICPVVNTVYPNDFRGIVQHEVGGHGFGKLGDENVCYYGFIPNSTYYGSFLIGKSYGWYDNLSLTGDMKSVPWSHLIFDSDYSDIVDIYEGGYYCSRGVFRSESNSCMNNMVPYFSTISRESIVKRIKEYAGETFSYEEFKAKDVKTAGN